MAGIAEEGDNPWVFLHFRFLLFLAPIFGLVQKLNQQYFGLPQSFAVSAHTGSLSNTIYKAV